MRKIGDSVSPKRGKGSHIVLRHPERHNLLVSERIGRGLLTSLLKDAGVSRDEFIDLL